MRFTAQYVEAEIKTMIINSRAIMILSPSQKALKFTHHNEVKLRHQFLTRTLTTPSAKVYASAT